MNRRLHLVGAVALIVAGLFLAGTAIWWGVSAGWDLSVRVDTPRIVDPSAGVVVIGGFVTSAVLLLAGGWVLAAGRR